MKRLLSLALACGAASAWVPAASADPALPIVKVHAEVLIICDYVGDVPPFIDCPPYDTDR